MKNVCDKNYEAAMHYDCQQCETECEFRKGDDLILLWTSFLAVLCIASAVLYGIIYLIN